MCIAKSGDPTTLMIISVQGTKYHLLILAHRHKWADFHLDMAILYASPSLFRLWQSGSTLWLALKAFTDQKRCFFPHLDNGLQNTDSFPKKHRGPQEMSVDPEITRDLWKLLDVLSRLEKEVPNVEIFTFERLDWLKRANSLPSSTNESSIEHNFHSSNKLSSCPVGAIIVEKVAIIELLCPSVFRVVVSLHPSGSIDPDDVAFFSPDEHWICSYQTLFTKTCSKCGRLLAMDRQKASMLSPVHRPYWLFSMSNISATISSTKDQNIDVAQAYHVGCS
ncbi:mediator of RNA polymerase II transcription subunit 27 [Quillaja saponaria]|uniref:Mediator of RNA polymerase II transcription subunit 27 n=1 Tax=Quillaja saponaria TaxID=32244 RepID=A0AAD7PYV4_QUISA|nr:mediator of RNA polymerase II transcription subunit 27 [Quillaja saponaria]